MMFSRSNCGGGSRGVDKPMRNNWGQHAKSNDNFSSRDKILKSNFLFSLSPQKRSVEEPMAATARYLLLP